jgi:acyl carrier protein
MAFAKHHRLQILPDQNARATSDSAICDMMRKVGISLSELQAKPLSEQATINTARALGKTGLNTQTDYLVKLREVLAEEFEIDSETIVPDANLYEDLDIDSIDAVDLIVRLKEITGKRVPPEKFQTVRTVGDVVKVLENL